MKYGWSSLVVQTVKNLPALWETLVESLVESLGREDPLQKGMATHSRIPWTVEPGKLQSMGSQKSRTQLSNFTHLILPWSFPGGTSGKEPACQCRKCKRRGLDREDLLEEVLATYSSILSWRIPWTEEPGGLWSIGPQSQHD